MAQLLKKSMNLLCLKHNVNVNVRLVSLLKLAYSKEKRGQNFDKITKPLQYTKVTAINASQKVKHFCKPIIFNNDLINACFVNEN